MSIIKIKYNNKLIMMSLVYMESSQKIILIKMMIFPITCPVRSFIKLKMN